MKKAAEIEAAIVGAKVDRDGQWKLTLEAPASEGAKVAALALYTEQVFTVSFATQDA